MRNKLKLLVDFVLSETISKAILTIGDQGVVSAASFGTSIIIGRICSKDELGLYMLGFNIILFSSNLQAALVNSAHIVYSPRLSGRDHARYTGSTLIHQLLYSVAIILGLALATLGLSFASGDLASMMPVTGVLAVFITFILLKEYARQVCFASLRSTAALTLDSAAALLQLGGLVLLALTGVLSAWGSYAVIGASCLVVTVAWLFSMRRRLALDLRAAWGDFVRNWAYARWLVYCNFIFLASIHLYPWLLVAFHGTEANGAYGACNGVLFLANPFLLGMGNFIGPKAAHALSEGGVEAMKRLTYRANLFFAVTMGSFCLAMVVLGGWIVTLLYGEKYAGNGLLVIMLALGQLPLALTVPTNYALNAMERSDVQFKSLLVALAVTATVGIWLVVSLGPVGVATGIFAANSATCLYKYIIFRKELHALSIQGNAT